MADQTPSIDTGRTDSARRAVQGSKGVPVQVGTEPVGLRVGDPAQPVLPPGIDGGV